MDNALDLKGLYWKREDKVLLNGIDWQVKKGEHWALMGLNGSGKTTLLNMITGYTWPTKGAITVLGRKFGETDLRALRQSIGWVSSSLQEKLYAGDRAQSVVISGKFATIGLYDKPSEEDYDRAAAIMDMLGCAKLWDREYRTCSQGEKQKLLIGRALMANPQLLILDEPCNGLDLFSRERLLQSFQALTERDDMPTLIYVTHHTEEILPVFSHTLLLRRGEVYAAGETQKLMNADTLSGFFEAPVDVEWKRGRVYVGLSAEAAAPAD